ncbi:MAG TPA: hypothetical protein VHU13_10270 [Solirubrobacteraceae bacterium]|nr:hypothetical protein [Solirubrobacteraceae bacterium]
MPRLASTVRRRSPTDAGPYRWIALSNTTLAVLLILVMVAVTYGIRPYGGHPTGWTSPSALALLAGSLACLVAFLAVERHTSEPMFRLALFRIRAFSFGTPRARVQPRAARRARGRGRDPATARPRASAREPSTPADRDNPDPGKEEACKLSGSASPRLR